MRRCFGIIRNLHRCGRMGDWRWFCREHRRQPAIWVSFLLFTIAAGTASIYSAWWPKALSNVEPSMAHIEHPILVTPSSLDIVSGYQRRRAGFWVYNTTNRPYYDVWIQLTLQLSDIDMRHVSVVEPRPAIDSYSFLKDGDSLPVGARGIDSSGNNAIWTILWELPPNGKREYVVELREGVNLTDSSRVKASVSVLHFQDTPVASVYTTNDRVTVEWTNRAYKANELIIEFKGWMPPHLLQGTDKLNRGR